MAVYNITHLNYITTGSGRNFVNMDIQEGGNMDNTHILDQENGQTMEDSEIVLERNDNVGNRTNYIAKEFDDVPTFEQHQEECEKNALSQEKLSTGLILDEEQPEDFNSDTNKNTFVKLELSCCDGGKQQLFEEYAAKTKQDGHIFEVEFIQDNQTINTCEQGGNKVLPIYDLDDLCVKSKFTQKNNKIHDWDYRNPGQSEDVYLPDGVKTVDIKQCGNMTYLLTEPTNDGPIDLGVEIQEYCGLKTSQHNMILEGEKNNTYLYTSVSAMGGDQTQTYANVIDKYLKEQQTSLNFFKPALNLRNIKYNYIYSVDMNKKDGSSGYVSEYKNGNIYGTIYNAKNMYNSTYSMDMPSDEQLVNCRQYKEFIECGGRLFLKYYDNVDYQRIPDELSSEGLSSYNMMSTTNGYPYQKIEQMDIVSIKTTNEHKSYFFTVALDTEINSEQNSDGSYSSENFKKLKDMLKKDITNSIKKIVENVCPVQTQLLNVTFG